MSQSDPMQWLDPLPQSEMLRRVRAFDWSRTPLGPIGDWPQSLKTAVQLCLSSRFPLISSGSR